MASPSDGNEKVGLWVPVEPGLFQYPLAQGEAPALLANRCKKCKKSFFPKRKLCPACCLTTGSYENQQDITGWEVEIRAAKEAYQMASLGPKGLVR